MQRHKQVVWKQFLRVAAVSLLAAAAAAEPCRTATQACLETIPVAAGLGVTVYRSHPVAPGQPDLERAVIVIHGTLRDADRYFTGLVAAAEKAGAADRSLLLSPYFRGRGRNCNDKTAPGELVFDCEGWKYGDEAATGGGVYSFTVVDRIIRMLADRAKFPKMRAVVVVGHSAGGQFVQRYAASTQVDREVKLPVRFVVMNPSSYMYLDGRRLRPGASCSDDGRCSGPFETAGAADGCPGYNLFRYGMENRAGYVALAGAGEILKRYPAKDVVYLVGENDVDPNDSSLDKSCAARKQGAYRRERGTVFWSYMKSLYGARHGFAVAPGCAHNGGCMLASEPALKALFR